MAVSKAIRSGETESVGNLKDILSGVVASHCVSSRLCRFVLLVLVESLKELEAFVGLLPELQTFILDT